MRSFVTLTGVLALHVLAFVLAAGGVAQDARRGFPQAMRGTLIGCWDLGREETVRFEPEGEHGLRALHSLPRGDRGGPTRYAESAYYLPGRDVLQMGCRPRSQHGQFCELRVRDDGALDVQVYARGHGGSTTGHLVETFVARRCD